MYDNCVAVLQMVVYGRADLILNSIDVLKYTIRNDIPELEKKLECFSKPLTSQSVYMGLNKKVADNQVTLKRFNKVLESLK